MIVSETRNFVFIHLAKTRGSVIRYALLPLPDPDQDAEMSIWNKRGENVPRAEINPDYPASRRSVLTMTFEENLFSIMNGKTKSSAVLPQTHWLPKRGMMSFIGLFEFFSQNLKPICGHVAPDVPVPTAFDEYKVSAKKDEWRSMGAYVIDSIRQSYADDFARFGYNTDPAALPAEPFPLKLMRRFAQWCLPLSGFSPDLKTPFDI